MDANINHIEIIDKPMEFSTLRTNARLLLISVSTFLLFASAFSPLPFDEHQYQIETNSQLVITGASNVNEFTCDCSCERDFTRSTLEISRHPESNRIDFANARLKLTTTNLDCGHKVMNKDLYETLRAKEYPQISITLLQARIPAEPQQRLVSFNQWMNIDAFTRITIAGQDKRVHIPVKGRRIEGDRFHFTGEISLNMTDFGLTPPTAMLGLIKVNDKITINLDLVVRILKT